MTDKGIKLTGVCKKYGGTVALDRVDLTVYQGKVVGLLGPDGAGKTSLMRIIATVMLPDGGDVRVAGFDAVSDYREIRSRVGYVPGRFALYQDLTVAENLEFFATVFGTTVESNIHRIKDIYSQIEPFSDRLAGQLSGGMKQKLALSCALIHEPEILLLDEPTTGVDPVSRREFWDMIELLRETGMAVLVSTPYMDEAARCDQVVLIDEGRILAQGAPESLAADFAWPLIAVRGGDRTKLIEDLRKWEPVHSAYPFGDSIHLAAPADALNLPDLLPLKKYLKETGHDDLHLIEINPGLEDRFMDLLSNPIQST